MEALMREHTNELGEDMYALLGIPRTDRQGRLVQWARCGMAMGFPDPSAVNTLRSDRIGVDELAQFRGFQPRG